MRATPSPRGERGGPGTAFRREAISGLVIGLVANTDNRGWRNPLVGQLQPSCTKSSVGRRRGIVSAVSCVSRRQRR